MKHVRRHRLIAMLLLVAMLVSSMPAVVSYASDSTGEVKEELYGGRTADEILTLISGKTYQNYMSTNSGQTVANDESKVIIDCSLPENIVKPGDDDYMLGDAARTTSQFVISDSFSYMDVDGTFKTITAPNENGVEEAVKGVYTPASGKTTFRIEVKESGMYSIDLKYIPIEYFDYDQDRDEDKVSTMTTI